MILDAHTHIFPPEVCRDRERWFADEDDFRLLYQDPRAQLVGATELVAHLDAIGVAAACTFGFPWHSETTARIGNDYVLDAAARFPGRLIPFACVDPLNPGARAEAERCLVAGARGVGEVATYHAGLGPVVREALGPLADLCREAMVPLLLHTNEAVGHDYPGKSRIELGEIYALIRAHPDTTWILGHWGGGLFVYHLLRKEAEEVLGNVYYDTAAGPYLYQPGIYRAFAAAAGCGRLLYGSDYPLLGLPRYRQDLDQAGLSEADTAAVLGGNLARLLGLGKAP